MEVIYNRILVEEGQECQYINSTYMAKVTGIISFGEWRQDGSGGEYSGTDCYGFYIEVTDLEPASWSDETKEEIESYYPWYEKNFSLLSLLNNECQQYSELTIAGKKIY